MKVLDHKYKVLFKNISGRHVITEADPKKIVQLEGYGITNFFILGNLKTIKRVLGIHFQSTISCNLIKFANMKYYFQKILHHSILKGTLHGMC